VQILRRTPLAPFCPSIPAYHQKKREKKGEKKKKDSAALGETRSWPPAARRHPLPVRSFPQKDLPPGGEPTNWDSGGPRLDGEKPRSRSPIILDRARARPASLIGRQVTRPAAAAAMATLWTDRARRSPTDLEQLLSGPATLHQERAAQPKGPALTFLVFGFCAPLAPSRDRPRLRASTNPRFMARGKSALSVRHGRLGRRTRRTSSPKKLAEFLEASPGLEGRPGGRRPCFTACPGRPPSTPVQRAGLDRNFAWSWLGLRIESPRVSAQSTLRRVPPPVVRPLGASLAGQRPTPRTLAVLTSSYDRA